MANKTKPGIPANFTFDVAPVADLGDYLDERGPSPVSAKRGREVTPTPESSPVVPVRTRVPDAEPPSAAPVRVPERVAPANADVQQVTTAPNPAPFATVPERDERPRAPRHTGPRREINMSPEALRMSDELLDLIRSGSGQRDTKANELMHALLLLAFEVKDELDPHAIPKRGRWGTPTARAYPLEIKNAVLQALLKRYGDAEVGPVGPR